MFVKNLIVGIGFCVLMFNFSELSAKEQDVSKTTETFAPIVISTVMKSSAQKVWDVMLDFKNYHLWNGWVGKIDGEAKKDSVVRAYGRNSDKSLLLKIDSMQEPNKLCWTDVTWFTHFGIGGWRCRTIEELPGGQGVKFTNHFEYTGIFKRAFSKYTREILVKGMTLENESLRNYVEKK